MPRSVATRPEHRPEGSASEAVTFAVVVGDRLICGHETRPVARMSWLVDALSLAVSIRATAVLVGVLRRIGAVRRFMTLRVVGHRRTEGATVARRVIWSVVEGDALMPQNDSSLSLLKAAESLGE